MKQLNAFVPSEFITDKKSEKRYLSLPRDLQLYLKIYCPVQVNMQQVPRWGTWMIKYEKKASDFVEKYKKGLCDFVGNIYPYSEMNGKKQKLKQIRIQSSLEHSFSFSLLSDIYLSRIGRSQKIDIEMLALVIRWHDIGEGLLGRDISITKKNSNGQDDLDEYICFKELIKDFPENEYEMLRNAFLFQFIKETPENLNDDDLVILKKLKEKYSDEAEIFKALENIDYVIYAAEQYVKFDNISILVNVVDRSNPILTKTAEKHVGFGNVWTKEISDWADDFVDKNTKYLLKKK